MAFSSMNFFIPEKEAVSSSLRNKIPLSVLESRI